MIDRGDVEHPPHPAGSAAHRLPRRGEGTTSVPDTAPKTVSSRPVSSRPCATPNQPFHPTCPSRLRLVCRPATVPDAGVCFLFSSTPDGSLKGFIHIAAPPRKPVPGPLRDASRNAGPGLIFLPRSTPLSPPGRRRFSSQFRPDSLYVAGIGADRIRALKTVRSRRPRRRLPKPSARAFHRPNT